MIRRKELRLDDYQAGIEKGDRAVLGRALSLIESERTDHSQLAQDLLARLLPRTGQSIRVGLSGVPGVGKSTFIECLGTNLTSAGHRVAVLAVDPSSARSGGSVLGDKTRMQQLATDPNAFIRPSPTGLHLGGVTRKTQESMLLCEAFGFDVILVETVGVGQSETAVADMVDMFVLLLLGGAGDSLQGIKRGILEVADLIAVNKADGDNLRRAKQAQVEYQSALQLLPQKHPHWHVPVLTCSAKDNLGVEAIWQQVCSFCQQLKSSGLWQKQRKQQKVGWMWRMVEHEMHYYLHKHPSLAGLAGQLERRILHDELTPTDAARQLLGKVIPSY